MSTQNDVAPTPEEKKRLALDYQEKGFSVFPIKNPEHREDGRLDLEKTKGVEDRKQPAVRSLDRFKQYPASADEVSQWCDKDPNLNFGVFCGKVSNYAIVIDSDGKDADDRINDNIMNDMQSAVRTAFLNTMIVTTGSGGKHYYFILNDPIMENMPSKKIWDGDGPHSEIDILSNGHYVVGAGSRHPNGKYYTSNGKRPIPISKNEFIEIIKKVAKNPDAVLYSLERDNGGGGTTTSSTSSSGSSGSSSSGAGAGVVVEIIDNGQLTFGQRKVIHLLKWLYTEGNRQEWWLVVSGLLRRHPNIPIMDALKVCRNICVGMSDEEVQKRLKTVYYSYVNKQPYEVAGKSYFETVVKAKKNGLDKDELDKYVKNLERKVLAALFEMELEIVQRDNPCWLWSNKEGEKYVVVRKSDESYDIVEGKYKRNIRRVQLLEVKRAPIGIDGSADNGGRGDIISFNFTDVLLDAVPIGTIEILEDPIFDQVKYKMAFEYIDNNGQIKPTNSPVGPFTKEELKNYILGKREWVSKERILGDTINKMIDACRTKGMVETKIEIEAEGLFWIDSEKRLILSKREPYMPSPLEARQCLEVIENLQKTFYPVEKLGGLERKRFAHFTKVAIASPTSFARRQKGVIKGEHMVIPIQDLGNWSKVGKTTGYAGLCLRLFRNPFHEGSRKYQIAAGNIETEPRIIENTKWTTFAVILDDVDFLTDWQQNTTLAQVARRILTLIKNSVDMTNPRDVQTSANNKRQLPFCAYVLLTHNSNLINEDGFISRSTGHEFTQEDEKDDEVKKQYEDFFEEYGNTFAFLGDFALCYYLEHPEVLDKDWLTMSRTIINAFFDYAGLDEQERKDFQWLIDEVCESNTSRKGIAEHRSARIAAYEQDLFMNLYWSKFKREAAIVIGREFRDKFRLMTNVDWDDPKNRTEIDSIIISASPKEKIWALLTLGVVPNHKLHHKYGVCLTSGVVEELERKGVQRLSHSSLAAYCDSKTFKYTEKSPIRFGNSKPIRVVYASLDDFANFVSPESVPEAQDDNKGDQTTYQQ
jgi:hypothetical protein